MSHLNNQQTLKVESGNALTYNVQPLLHEVRHALQALLDSGESTVIDLRGLPLAPGELDKIENVLGRGEVNARLDALGPSEICETRYPGVWLVTHFNNDRQVMAKFIEITAIPSLLRAQDKDIVAGLQQLDEQLATLF